MAPQGAANASASSVLTRRLRSICGLVGGLLAVSALSGCSPDETREHQLDDYVERVARSVEASAVAPPPGDIADVVSPKLRPVVVPEDTIGLLDFLSLSGCELQVNLGRRNSHLGRSASPSQRLLLDLEFLRLSPACSAYVREREPELAGQLDAMAEARRNALAASIYNAVFAGPEWREFWQRPAAIGEYPATSGGDIVETLGRLQTLITQWLAGDYTADSQQLEALLGEIRTGDGGRLLRAAQQQARALAMATAVVDARVEDTSLCPFGNDTAQSRSLRRVARQFFARDLQPWLAALRRREALLLPPIRRIEAQLGSVLPEAYQQWRSQRDALLASLIEAPRHHAQRVSRALKPCGGIRPQ